jgi:hypothetical protein
MRKKDDGDIEDGKKEKFCHTGEKLLLELLLILYGKFCSS